MNKSFFKFSDIPIFFVIESTKFFSINIPFLTFAEQSHPKEKAYIHLQFDLLVSYE